MAVIFKHVSDPLPLPSSVKPDISPQVETVILKALSKNPNDRFTNVAEFVAAWKQALPMQGDVTRRPSPQPEKEPPISVITPGSPDIEPKSNTSRTVSTAVIVGCLAVLCLLLTFAGGLGLLLKNWGDQITAATERVNGLPTPEQANDVIATAVPAIEATQIPSGEEETASTVSDLNGEQFTMAIGDEIAKDSPEPGAGFIENPGARDIYNFTATAGQTVYFQVLEIPTDTNLVKWRLLDEADSEIFNTCLQCGDAGVQVLERGGAYTLIVGDELDLGSGSYAFKLWDVPMADTFPIEIGDEVTNGSPGEGAGFIESPGVKDEYTFTATAGHSVYFQVTQPPQSNDLLSWRVVDDTGSEIFNTCLQCSDPGVRMLDRGGVYALVVGNESGPATGTYGFKIWDVPPPDQFTINIGDTVSQDTPGPGAGNIESPGVKDEYTFTATAGQSVYFQVVQPPQSNDLLTWRVVDDTGSEIFNTCLQCGDPGAITLERGGTYTIMVGNESGAAVGTYEIRVYLP